jgi:hypothetical protein
MTNYRVCFLHPDRKVSVFYHTRGSSYAGVVRQAQLLCPRSMTVEVWNEHRNLEVLLPQKARDDKRAA